MTALVVGASAGVGRALGRALAERGHDVVLVARDPRDLAAEAAHLRLTYGSAADYIAADASDPEDLLRQIAERSLTRGPIRTLCLPIGASREDDDGTLDLPEVRQLLDVNLTVVIATVQAIIPQMLEAGQGDIVGFGSVAAVRGRGNNMVYAAAKRALESYFESLRHRTAGTGVHVQFYRLGYIDTQQTFGKRLRFPKAMPRSIALRVMRNLGRDIGTIHMPSFWYAIAALVRATPWRIFRKTKF